MRITVLLPVFTVMLLSLGLGACHSGVNTTSRGEPRANPNTVKSKEVILDKRVAEELRLVRVREATVSGDMLKVQADIQNTARNPVTVGYRFEWYDGQGMRVSSTKSGWQRRRLLSGETFSFNSIAPTSKAKDFRLKVTKAAH